jgi:SAM-dependent methyltransferase
MANQLDQYREVANPHELPQIFHYWSNRYVRPRLNSVCEADNMAEFFAKAFFAGAEACSLDSMRFISLGTGDCSVEIDVARRLKEMGLSNFLIECLEGSSDSSDRVANQARSAGAADTIIPIIADLNSWEPKPKRYCAAMSHHALHHIVELETLFQSIRTGLAPGGLFAVNDMIGRNGHMRWPESLVWIEAIWAFLSERYKFNQQLKRLERNFINWDCSNDGFDGMRTQDVLPLLVEQFHFRNFLAWGGVTDVFVDRAFGHNFDAESEQDRALIDFIQMLNDRLIDMGVVKPTTMIAVLSLEATETQIWRHWTPRFSIRMV